MMNFGPRNIGRIGTSVRASSNPDGQTSRPIDWSTVPVATESVELNDGVYIEAGEKYLRYGTILIRIEPKQGTGAMYGPYDPNATDGRQKISRGNALILDATISESENPEMFDGGSVFKKRILLDEDDKEAWADFELAFPNVRLISD